MSSISIKDKVVCRAHASRARGKRVLARDWRSKHGTRSKMRVDRAAIASISDAPQAGFCLALKTPQESQTETCCDKKRQRLTPERADIFAEPLKADIIAEL